MSDERFGLYMVLLGAAAATALIGVAINFVALLEEAPVYQGIGLTMMVAGMIGLYATRLHASRYGR